MALERTATGGSASPTASPSATYRALTSSRTALGTGASRIAARTVAASSRANWPPSPFSATNSANALVASANPGGTWIPALSSSPRLALLPPNVASSARRSSSSGRENSAIEHRDHARGAVDLDRLPGADRGRRAAGPDHGGEPVL